MMIQRPQLSFVVHFVKIVFSCFYRDFRVPALYLFGLCFPLFHAGGAMRRTLLPPGLGGDCLEASLGAQREESSLYDTEFLICT